MLSGADVLEDPWIQFGAVPAVIAFVATGILRFASGAAIGPRIASSGAAIALAVAFGLTIEPGTCTFSRTAAVIAAALVAGLVTDLVAADLRVLRRTLVIVAPLLALIWLRGAAFDATGTVPAILFGVAFIAIAVIAFSFSDFESGNSTPAILLAMAGLGIGLVLFFSGERVQGGLALSAAAGTGAFFLWNWPAQRLSNGAGLMIGVMAPLLAIAAGAAIEGTASRLGMALVILVFFADKVFRLPSLGGRTGRLVQPVLLASVCGLVVLAAVAAAVWTTV